MHSGALRALEFDRIVEAVCRFAQTPPGWPRLARLAPLTEPREVAAALDATAETVRFLAENPIGLRAPEDLDAIADGAVGRGTRARAAAAAGARRLPRVGRGDVRARSAARAARTRCCARLPTAAATFEPEIADIRRKIDPGGDVVDDASPELRSIRDRLRKQRTRLRGTLESYLRGKDTSKYLQQQIVTDRNGRYVLVVRAEHRSAIPGIVHGSSGSGASLFLEPLSTVEINNDIVALEQQEAEEVHRILLALTDAFRRRGDDLRADGGRGDRASTCCRRARSFSKLVDGMRPAIADRRPAGAARGAASAADSGAAAPPRRRRAGERRSTARAVRPLRAASRCRSTSC